MSALVTMKFYLLYCYSGLLDRRAAAGRNRRYAIDAGTMAAVAGEPDAANKRSPQRCKYAARILIHYNR